MTTSAGKGEVDRSVIVDSRKQIIILDQDLVEYLGEPDRISFGQGGQVGNVSFIREDCGGDKRHTRVVNPS
jgi:hypothetical protein